MITDREYAPRMVARVGREFVGTAFTSANGTSFGIAPPGSYEDAKRMARDPDRRTRFAVAEAETVAPEILYYMADDPDPEVRSRVAANPATPTQADGKLANDEDTVVRSALARKVALRAPELGPQHSHAHTAQTLALLEKLARDQLPVVRQVVAEVLKSESRIPPHIVHALARDIDLVVAAPVLEFSPVLADTDLLNILSSTPIPGAMSAVSRRQGLGAEVVDLVAKSDDTDALVALLNNATAQMREDTLDYLVERAHGLPPLHEPLVRRPQLSKRGACRLATFVADSLLDQLAARKDFDSETLGVLRQAVRARLEQDYSAQNATRDSEAVHLEQEVAAARLLHEKKPITEDLIRRSLDYEHWVFVKACLIVRSGCSIAAVRAILRSERPDAVLSLCWKAGLGSDTAVLVQRHLAGIAMPMRADGGELTPTEMSRILAGFEDEASL